MASDVYSRFYNNGYPLFAFYISEHTSQAVPLNNIKYTAAPLSLQDRMHLFSKTQFISSISSTPLENVIAYIRRIIPAADGVFFFDYSTLILYQLKNSCMGSFMLHNDIVFIGDVGVPYDPAVTSFKDKYLQIKANDGQFHTIKDFRTRRLELGGERLRQDSVWVISYYNSEIKVLQATRDDFTALSTVERVQGTVTRKNRFIQ